MIGALTNHLWQSTAFALAAGLLTLAFRKNRAQVRYWLWFSASLKFFVPFSLLLSLGSNVPAAKKIAAPPAVSLAMEQIAQPFEESAPRAPSTPSPRDWKPVALLGAWACGFASIAMIRFRGWLRIRAALSASTPVNIPAPVEVRASPGLLEPGVVGFLRPILLLPERIEERLTPPQLEAVLAHELCHVRRRDNLFAAVHMLVEATFWFHPLIWWIGARLVEERERACDEAVLSQGSGPRDYAEGILNVCKLYVESPLTCVSGVTGSDLKKRIQAIMTRRVAHDLNFAKKLALAVAGIAALAAPIAVGILNAPAIRAQSAPAAPPQFEVASIRLSKNPEPGGDVEITPGRFRGKDLALQWLILVAYRLNSANLSGDLPSWTISERYDIDAKTGDASGEGRILQALQALLKDRFALREHRETKQEPVYFLTIGKNGIKMPPGSCVPTKQDLPNECYSQKSDGLIQTMDWRGVRISDPTGVAYRTLAGHLNINKRPIIDKTGLTGTFDVHLRWARDPEPGGDTAAPAPSAEPAAPSIFDAMEEQLGLKLESGRGPVEHLIVDHVERPSGN